MSFVLLCIIVIEGQDAGQPPSSKPIGPASISAQIRDEAMPSWKAYLEQARLLQGTVSYKSKNTLGRAEETTVVSKRLESCELLHYKKRVSQGSNSEYSEALYAVNPHYSFKLVRKSEGDAWVLVDVFPQRGQPLPPEYRRTFELHFFANTRAVRFTYMSLLDAFSDSALQITSATEITNNGNARQIRVDFQFPHEPSGEFKDKTCGGTLLLDPNANWTVLESRRQVKEQVFSSLVTTVNSQFTFIGGISVPGLVKEVQDDTDASGRSVRIEHTTERALTDSTAGVTQFDFTLARFGFEEPFGSPFQPPTPWFLYAGITAGAILVLCVLLAWWQKRLQARA